MSTDDTFFTIQRIRPKREGGGTAPLGTVANLVQIFRRINTAPDREGSLELFGPGIRVRFRIEGGSPAAAETDMVASIELEVLEKELFEVMFLGTVFEKPGRLATTVRNHGWTLVNVETGYCFPQVRDDEDEEEGEEEEDSVDEGEAADGASAYERDDASGGGASHDAADADAP